MSHIYIYIIYSYCHFDTISYSPGYPLLFKLLLLTPKSQNAVFGYLFCSVYSLRSSRLLDKLIVVSGLSLLLLMLVAVSWVWDWHFWLILGPILAHHFMPSCSLSLSLLIGYNCVLPQQDKCWTSLLLCESNYVVAGHSRWIQYPLPCAQGNRQDY